MTCQRSAEDDGSPRHSHDSLCGLLAAAALRLSRLLSLRLCDRQGSLLLALRILGQASVGTVVVEKQHLAADDHRAAAQLASRLIVPGLVLQPANHPHALAGAHVLIDHLSQPAPGRDAMPVGLFAALAILAFP